LDFFFSRISAQFANTISKASNLCSAKFLSQENSKCDDPIVHGVKEALFFTSNAIILQSMWSKIWNLFAHIILILQN
jgi:hypothetical protein